MRRMALGVVALLATVGFWAGPATALAAQAAVPLPVSHGVKLDCDVNWCKD
jgi:hypothetical protein